jgi:hypothetical protein
MAWAKGTADDWVDFLRKLRDYAAGTIDPSTDPDITSGVVVPSGDQWTILTNGSGQPNVPGSGFATDGEVYLQGQGSDVDDEIIVGIRTYRNAPANVFGLEMRGYTAFDDTLEFDTMAGVSPPCRAAFDDAPFDCWFWVNSRRIMAVARVGTTDVLIHLGFISQFGTRNQYPYPLLISGSAATDAISFQTNNFDHCCLPDPCRLATHLRWVDGSWQEVKNFVTSVSRITTGNTVWPNRNPTTSAEGSQSSAMGSSEDEIFEGFQTGTGPYLSNVGTGLYSLFNTIIILNNALAGRVEGLMSVFGFGLVSGDELTVGSDDYDVFQCTWRTEPVAFFAVKRE